MLKQILQMHCGSYQTVLFFLNEVRTSDALRVETHIQRSRAWRPAACDLNLWKQISQNSLAASDNLSPRPLLICFD